MGRNGVVLDEVHQILTADRPQQRTVGGQGDECLAQRAGLADGRLPDQNREGRRPAYQHGRHQSPELSVEGAFHVRGWPVIEPVGATGQRGVVDLQLGRRDLEDGEGRKVTVPVSDPVRRHADAEGRRTVGGPSRGLGLLADPLPFLRASTAVARRLPCGPGLQQHDQAAEGLRIGGDGLAAEPLAQRCPVEPHRRLQSTAEVDDVAEGAP